MKRKLSVLLSIFLCVALCISTLGLAADSTGDGEPAATDAPEDAALRRPTVRRRSSTRGSTPPATRRTPTPSWR